MGGMRIRAHRRLSSFPSFPSFLSTCLSAILLAGALAGCGGGGDSSPADAAPPDAVPAPQLAEVQALFDRSCGGTFCHIGGTFGALDLTPGESCAELVQVTALEDDTQTLLVRGNPGASYLVCKSDPNCANLPPGADLMPIPNGLDATDLDLLSRWVAAGAPGCP
jgi:hypothetical protein